MLEPGDVDETVTCPACGRTVDREEAREYDKHGDRFDREGKSFEYLCRECHDGLCLQERDGLEDLLVEVEAGSHADVEFLDRFLAASEDGDEPLEER